MWVGFDVGKAFHWVCVLDEEGEVVLSRRVGATERDLEVCLEEIAALGGDRTFGIDLLGGPATLLEAVLAGNGERVFYLPGTAADVRRKSGEPTSVPKPCRNSTGCWRR